MLSCYTIYMFTVTFGGWYQRTTLHLSEIYDLFALGSSHLALNKKKLGDLYRALDLKTIRREAGNLEFIKATTKSGIEIRYYEDGLYILEKESSNIKIAQKELETYFEKAFNPAVAYIFSLGAPTPKILANIKTVHPTVVSVSAEDPNAFRINATEFGEVYSSIASGSVVVHKLPHYIFVVANGTAYAPLRDLVGMQIFFREFKDQLEKYLNIHRSIWEEISDIKERKSIRGNEVEPLRARLDSYQKTISLISNRINQMASYIRTRSSVAKGLKIEDDLKVLFQFKFEVLTDTHDYIKELWKMTNEYLNSAIQNIVEIKNQSTSRGIQSLQVITSIGVVSGIIGYFAKNELPRITAFGVVYFAAIIAVAWLINFIISKISTTRRYTLKFSDRAKNL